MSIEGHLRDLTLAEVLQLLWAGRKTGLLHLRSHLEARVASIAVDAGWIVAASEGDMYDGTPGGAPGEAEPTTSERVLELLRWTEGEFQFVAKAVGVHPSQVRVPTEFLLMEGARRADAWAAIRDVVSGPRVVPTFPEMQRQQLSQLRLLPDEWEILTLVDGVRSIHDLASALRRDVVEVATTVHGLIEAGVLVLNDAPVTQRAPSMPTPLVNSSLPQDRAEQPPADSHRPDVPPVYSPEMPFSPPFESSDDDSLFDPVQLGVMTADGMPSFPPPGSGSAWAVPAERVVAPHPADPSGEGKGMEAAVAEHARLLRAADDAAKSGDLVAAIELWSQWLALPTGEPVGVVHERISLARQLHALLHP